MKFKDVDRDALRLREDGVYILEIPALNEVRCLDINISCSTNLGNNVRLEIHAESWIPNVSVILVVDGRAPINAVTKKLRVGGKLFSCCN